MAEAAEVGTGLGVEAGGEVLVAGDEDVGGEEDAVSEVVGVAGGGGEELFGLLFEGEEVLLVAGLLIGLGEDLAGEAVDDGGADVGAGAGGVDAAGVGGLEDVVGRADLLHGVEATGGEEVFGGGGVPAGGAGAGGAVAEVEGGEGGVVGGFGEGVGRAEGLVHGVDEVAVVDDVFRAVAMLEGDGGAPDAGLGVAAHAVGAHEVAGVADAAVDGGAAGAIEDPGVDLAHVVVDGLLDGLAGVGVRGEVAEAEFDFVAGGVGFDLEEVDAAGLEGAGDGGAVGFGLLVDAFVGVGADAVLFAVGGVDE